MSLSLSFIFEKKSIFYFTVDTTKSKMYLLIGSVFQPTPWNTSYSPSLLGIAWIICLVVVLLQKAKVPSLWANPCQIPVCSPCIYVCIKLWWHFYNLIFSSSFSSIWVLIQHQVYQFRFSYGSSNIYTIIDQCSMNVFVGKLDVRSMKVTPSVLTKITL